MQTRDLTNIECAILLKEISRFPLKIKLQFLKKLNQNYTRNEKVSFENFYKRFKSYVDVILSSRPNAKKLFSIPSIGGFEEIYEKTTKLIEYCKKEGINIISFTDDIYPQSFRELYDSPIILFTKGDLSILKNFDYFISIVGTRNPTEYGKNIMKKLFALVLKKVSTEEKGFNKKISIVSGLALGIDSFAHKISLESEVPTIAILGNGINYHYPPSNKNLQNQIGQKGLIISEYFPTEKPHPGYFPRRNRLIGSLGKKIIVVEGSEKSGSLITAYFALNYGKDIFVFPGNIFSRYSQGCNRLIKEGASPIISFNDLENIFTSGY
jgi:DNA processing protein